MTQTNLPETLTWQAASHIQPRRSPIWYLFFIIAAAGLIGFAIYSRSILTGITFGLIIVIVLVVSNQAAREVTYKITKTGISVGSMTYPFKVIKKFWIAYNPPEVKTLNLETIAYLNNRVIIQLGRQNPVEVKLFLSKYLPEDLDREEPFSESLARRLKI